MADEGSLRETSIGPQREFHERAATWIAETGIAQFIDIGCGLLTTGNTHEVVWRIDPAARVAYVDCDPVVVSHAAALLNGTGEVSITVADLRDPVGLLAALRTDGLVDLDAPCALLMSAVLHLIPAADDPVGAVTRLTAALAPGSFLALSHVTADGDPPGGASTRTHPRDRAEVVSFFRGLELVPPWPGATPQVTRISLWGRSSPPGPDEAATESWWAGVGRKTR